MLTIRTLQRIKTGSLVTLYNGIYAVIIGIFYLGLYRFILKDNFSAIKVVWDVFSKYNPELMNLFIKLVIIKALFIITIGIVIIYLSSYIYKRKDKATWVMLFVIGLLFWPTLLTFEVLDKNFYTIVVSFIGWLSFIIGMLIPIKYYMQSDEEEY